MAVPSAGEGGLRPRHAELHTCSLPAFSSGCERPPYADESLSDASKETVMTVGTAPPSVFDADLPTLSYGVDETPAAVYPRLRAAQQQAPIAIGPLGPEVLSYQLVRAVLRDERFQPPPGIVLQAQGVTSGPLWDKVINSLLCVEGETHRRLRGSVLQGVHPSNGCAPARRHGRRDERSRRPDRRQGIATSSPTSLGPTPSRSSARCSAHPAKTGSSSRRGPTTSSKPSASPPTSGARARRHAGLGRARRLRRRYGRPIAGTALPTTCSPT